jgi:hypothetical protein
MWLHRLSPRYPSTGVHIHLSPKQYNKLSKYCKQTHYMSVVSNANQHKVFFTASSAKTQSTCSLPMSPSTLNTHPVCCQQRLHTMTQPPGCSDNIDTQPNHHQPATPTAITTSQQCQSIYTHLLPLTAMPNPTRSIESAGGMLWDPPPTGAEATAAYRSQPVAFIVPRPQDGCIAP